MTAHSPRNPAAERLFLNASAPGAEPETIALPEEIGKQAATAVRYLANSLVVVAETGHKEVIEDETKVRLQAELAPLHHKYRSATRNLYTVGYREAQQRGEHIRSLLHGIARCLATPSEPTPITVLARAAIEAAALIAYAQDPALNDLDRCTRYAALSLAGHHSLNNALREMTEDPEASPRLVALRSVIQRAGMTVHYDRNGKKPVSVSNSLTVHRKETCSPNATELTKKVVGAEMHYRLFSGVTHGSAGHMLLLQDWTEVDQYPVRLGQMLTVLLGLADAVPAAFCAILEKAGLDCAPVNRYADLLVGLVQRMADNMPEEARVTIPSDRRADRAARR